MSLWRFINFALLLYSAVRHIPTAVVTLCVTDRGRRSALAASNFRTHGLWTLRLCSYTRSPSLHDNGLHPEVYGVRLNYRPPGRREADLA